MGKQQRKNQKSSGQYLKYSGLAFQIMLIIGLLVWCGYWLDQKLENKVPYLTLIFALLALIGVIYKLIRNISKPE